MSNRNQKIVSAHHRCLRSMFSSPIQYTIFTYLLDMRADSIDAGEGGAFTLSVRKIARDLNTNRRTVNSYTISLIKSRLLTRSSENKYSIDMGLLNYYTSVFTEIQDDPSLKSDFINAMLRGDICKIDRICPPSPDVLSKTDAIPDLIGESHRYNEKEVISEFLEFVPSNADILMSDSTVEKRLKTRITYSDGSKKYRASIKGKSTWNEKKRIWEVDDFKIENIRPIE